MECKDVRDRLLDCPHAPEVMAHLAVCCECAPAAQELASTLGLLDEWQAPEPSAFFATRMSARLREERERSAASPWWSVWAWRPATAGALAIVLALGIGWNLRPPDTGTPARLAAPKGAVADLQTLDKNQDLLADDLLDDLQPVEAPAQDQL